MTEASSDPTLTDPAAEAVAAEPAPAEAVPAEPAAEPVPADTGEGVDKDNWQDAEHVRWSFQHVDEVLPTTPISRGEGPVAEFPVDLRDLGEVEIPETQYSETRTVRSVIESSDTDAWMVVHQGRVLTEEYFGAMQPETEHLLMSVSKSLVGTVAGVLVGAGEIDTARLITDYVP